MKKQQLKMQRNYKDTVFRMLFNNKEALLSLYNAINGTHYDRTDDLEIITLENAVYMAMKNDIAFILGLYMNLYEHQSTLNPNMPLRDLFYIAKQMEKLVVDDTLYSSRVVKIPTPKFIVFYNGVDACEERRILKLSDEFQKKEEEVDLELKVLVLNINAGMNRQIMESCQTLKEYSIYVERVRKYRAVMPIEQAVEKAVTECIRENILADFLKKQRAEVVAMSILEYNEEEELKKIRASERRGGYDDGWNAGRIEGEAAGKIAGRIEGEAVGKIAGKKEVLLEILEEKGIDISLDVENVSQRDGYEIVQIYIIDNESTITRRYKELKAFQKIYIEAKSCCSLVIHLDSETFKIWDYQMNHLIESGTVDILIASHSEQFITRKLTILK